MKTYIVFCNNKEYHDSEDVVVRFFSSEQDDPREPEDGVFYKDIPLSATNV
jgi:hypothetical protein